MKRILCTTILLTSAIWFANGNRILEFNGCHITITHDWVGERITSYFDGYGNVYVVPDSSKETVDMYVCVLKSPLRPTKQIFRCTDKPRKCGEWRFVSSAARADISIRFVKSEDDGEDITITFTKDRSKAGSFTEDRRPPGRRLF